MIQISPEEFVIFWTISRTVEEAARRCSLAIGQTVLPEQAMVQADYFRGLGVRLQAMNVGVLVK
jgi:hypothetical protein